MSRPSGSDTGQPRFAIFPLDDLAAWSSSLTALRVELVLRWRAALAEDGEHITTICISDARLAQVVGRSGRAVALARHELVEAGRVEVVEVVRGRRGGTVYRLPKASGRTVHIPAGSVGRLPGVKAAKVFGAVLWYGRTSRRSFARRGRLAAVAGLDGAHAVQEVGHEIRRLEAAGLVRRDEEGTIDLLPVADPAVPEYRKSGSRQYRKSGSTNAANGIHLNRKSGSTRYRWTPDVDQQQDSKNGGGVAPENGESSRPGRDAVAEVVAEVVGAFDDWNRDEASTRGQIEALGRRLPEGADLFGNVRARIFKAEAATWAKSKGAVLGKALADPADLFDECPDCYDRADDPGFRYEDGRSGALVHCFCREGQEKRAAKLDRKAGDLGARMLRKIAKGQRKAAEEEGLEPEIAETLRTQAAAYERLAPLATRYVKNDRPPYGSNLNLPNPADWIDDDGRILGGDPGAIYWLLRDLEYEREDAHNLMPYVYKTKVMVGDVEVAGHRREWWPPIVEAARRRKAERASRSRSYGETYVAAAGGVVSDVRSA